MENCCILISNQQDNNTNNNNNTNTNTNDTTNTNNEKDISYSRFDDVYNYLIL